jgi:putative Holliday junction resolvase
MRVLALDYGRARCGCAVSDPTGVLASPIEAVRAPGTRRGLARLRSLVRQHAVERVVVGLPLTLAGRDSAQTIETREFAARLAGELPVPVELYDERLTTRLAERTGGRADEDSRAAAHLLESWLASQPGQIRMGWVVAGDGGEDGVGGRDD